MRAMVTIAAAGLLAACDGNSPGQRGHIETVAVQARAETKAVGTPDDAADDPAIWRNRADPAASLIVATDKKAGLYVYGLDGAVRSFTQAGRVNNVDLIDLGASGILVVASDRNDERNAKLQLYRLDAATAGLARLGEVSGGTGEAYGICLWRDGERLFVFSVLKEGRIHQVRIDLSGPRPSGQFVRQLKVPSQPEGCVVDGRSRMLYVGEEDRGIWRFRADPKDSPNGLLVAPVDRRHLVADVEGLALAPAGKDGGYLIASSQGDNAFALYELPRMKPAGRFRVAASKFGSTEETDGIALALGSFGAQFPGGLLVVQDGDNQPTQNFKLVAWADVGKALRPAN